MSEFPIVEFTDKAAISNNITQNVAGFASGTNPRMMRPFQLTLLIVVGIFAAISVDAGGEFSLMAFSPASSRSTT